MFKDVKFLFVVNDLGYFISHRVEIAKSIQALGGDVVIAYGDLGRADVIELEKLMIKSVRLNLRRGGKNFFFEMLSLISIIFLLWRLRPDIIHFITIKPCLYGGLASRILKVKCVVSAVAGLGGMLNVHSVGKKFLRSFLYPLFRIAFGHPNQTIILQNNNDAKVLIRWRVLDQSKVRILRGSGVNLADFTKFNEVGGIPVVCFAARLLRDKGIYDFLSASHILLARGVKARFWIAGDLDSSNSSSLTQEDLFEIQNNGTVEVLGFQKNLPELYSKSHIVCLPSFYGEGVPKSLIEAAAASRVVVTTDHPGCKDAIEPGKSGLLVPINSPELLANALEWLIEHPKERVLMGSAGRRLAEKEFSIQKIVKEHLDIYEDLWMRSK
jgi:glycosyltransferase involved in cell wall biosynthesis